MHPALTQHGEDLLRLVRTDIVVRQDALDILHAGLNDLRIIRAAILTKQKLKDVDRHIRAFLDLLRQVFPDDLSVKELPQFLVDHCVLIAGFSGLHLLIHSFHLTGQSRSHQQKQCRCGTRSLPRQSRLRSPDGRLSSYHTFQLSD